MNSLTRRTLPTETKVLDEKLGIVEYTASSESIDSAREVIMQDGWDFSKFGKNAPFVNSHDYSSIENLVGRITDWRVEKKELILTAQWAKDIPGTLGEVGWKLTIGGFLKAVSVGFWPQQMVTKWDQDPSGYRAALKKAGYTEQDNVAVVYLKSQLVELSAVILGANPDAVARAYKAGALNDDDLKNISARLKSQPGQTAQEALNAAAACASSLRTRRAFSFAVNATAASIAVSE
jgi:hypothetical protein